MGDPSVRSELDSAPYTARSVVVDPSFDWEGEVPIRHRWRDTVLYELHVKGFTALHDRVPEEQRGTYAGLGSPAVVDYLRDLGVTAVELLPVHQFFSEPALLERGPDQLLGLQHDRLLLPRRGLQLVGRPRPAGHRVQADGEVAARRRHRGVPRRGLQPHRRGRLARPDDLLPRPRRPRLLQAGAAEPDPDTGVEVFDDNYWDVTGCGNTVDSNDPLALRLILDSLRYWVTEMHVDGFRFDLMSALTRTGYDIDMNCRLLVAIGQDPVLRHVKLIAEPWDASMDGYLVGGMPPPWVEWNDQYRDEIRDFWRNHTSGIRTVATRLAGSSDLYADDGRSAYNSINFVTAHDGFTLRDLVTYEHKHNEANGEDNRDGTDNNRSWNHGFEGETEDPR